MKQKPYDQVWCVMDTERQDNPETRDDLSHAIKLASANGIELILSNPSFEVWLIAHFLRTSQAFFDSDAAENFLDGLIQTHCGVSYRKGDRDIFRRLESKVEYAIENTVAVRITDHGDQTEIVDCNSSTDVDRLVEVLRGNRQPPGRP